MIVHKVFSLLACPHAYDMTAESRCIGLSGTGTIASKVQKIHFHFQHYCSNSKSWVDKIVFILSVFWYGKFDA